MPENSDNPCATVTPHRSSLLRSIEPTSASTSTQNAPNPTIPASAFDSVDPKYPSKTGKYAFTRSAVVARGHECLEWLRARNEKVIAVVSHSGFLRTAIAHTRFANADYRIFDFVPNGNELEEWASTEKSGGGMGWSERGRAEIRVSDFPRVAAAEEGKGGEVLGGKEGKEGREMEGIEEQPAKVAGEVVGEAPR